MLLYAATKNKGKLREFLDASAQSAVPDLRIEPLPSLPDLAPPVETGSTFEENAALKARYYSGSTDGFVFADDSGLEVDALGGAPGVYSARYAGSSANDQQNNRLLLDNLRGQHSRSGRFVCAIALACQGRVLITSRGTVEGEILEEPRGSEGFGYDPLFYCPEIACSFAEASREQKFQLSHRGRAFRLLLQQIAAQGLDQV
ncbi:MAG TPA: RdgB/HAM1 family non-canonical purine NTP pyrophosphatase [Bryobacteraceae bacterium]|nr:RdgB/HAM1 family non-canonical purine NTP pyrophosphatase [Bryobacteraceae bacterium]